MASISAAPSTCVASAPLVPTIFGTEFLSVNAELVEDYSRYVSDQDYVNHPEIVVQNASFCNVSLTYTHPGRQDTVTVEVWLPLSWNGRFQAVGSGGWTAGRTQLSYSMMSGAIGMGYATATTDAGLGSAQMPHEWALLSPGNVNLHALESLASVSLNEQVRHPSSGHIGTLCPCSRPSHARTTPSLPRETPSIRMHQLRPMLKPT